MFNIYSENTKGQKTYLSWMGEPIVYDNFLANQQLELLTQLPYRSNFITWHKIKVK